MQRDDATLLDILRAARLASQFVAGLTQDAFERDLRTQSAVLHQLMVLGEAVKRLSEEFRTAHATVPWSLIAGMRDKLIHAYDEVDLVEVWRTLRQDLPELLRQLEPLCPANGASVDPRPD